MDTSTRETRLPPAIHRSHSVIAYNRDMQVKQWRVRGRVSVHETGEGIPGLVVTATDGVEGVTGAERNIAEAARAGEAGRPTPMARRIGAVITDENGAFELAYADPGRAIDLMVSVSAPDLAGGERAAGPLFVSTERRRGAGSLEEFSIEVPRAKLEAAGQVEPQAGGNARRRFERATTSLGAMNESRIKIAAVQRAASVAALEAVRALDAKIETTAGDLREALLRTPPSLRAQRGFAKDETAIDAACAAVIDAGIRERINPSRLRSRLSLSAETIEKLGGTDALESGVILSETEFEALTHGDAPGTVALYRNDPVDQLCRGEHAEEDECVALLTGVPHEGGSGNGTPDSDGETPSDEPATAEERLDRALQRLLANMTSPENPVAFGISGPADDKAIREKLAALEIGSGPADVPRYYDFYNLQLAFEHVWMEALDESLIVDAQEAYRRIVELGGQAPPPRPGGTKVLQPMLVEARLLQYAEVSADPPPEVLRVFDVTPAQWSVLDSGQRQSLTGLSGDIIALEDQEPGWLFGWSVESRLPKLRRQGERLLEFADRKIRYAFQKRSVIGYGHLHGVLEALEKRLRAPYSFTVYGASVQQRSINFGVLAHYRQQWTPLNYQAGELAKTITLAPGEKRKFSTKQVVKRSHAEKIATSESLLRSRDTSDTARVESEIVRKAQSRTNFSLGTEGTYNVLLSKGSATSTFSTEAASDSQDVKRQFRESVVKAAEEYKQERTHEVSTSEESTFEVTSSGELVNPNDELAVTYLFYELQRRFRVAEQLHSVTPVIFVAQEVPKPDEIDEDWLIAHDWILRRVILDASYLPALAYLSTRVVGDEYALEERRKTLEQQRRLAERLEGEVVAVRRTLEESQREVDRAIERQAEIQESEDSEGSFTWVSEWFAGNDESPEAARIRKDAAEGRLERVRSQERELFARLEREKTALNAAAEAYTTQLQEHLNRRVQIERLEVHVKQNILHYMQAIWSHEPPDQRFFRLHKVRVPTLGGTRSYQLKMAPVGAVMYPHWTVRPVDVVGEVHIEPELEFKTLAEVADLDNPLGFKGNYMIFPLKQSNPLTDYMLTPYLHPVLGVRDPDEDGNWTLDGFLRYVCCLRDRLSTDEFEARRDALAQQYKRLLQSPSLASSEIVVPSGSLFIEALPGTHSLLEKFKEMHRGVDVKRVQGEVRERELENLRLARRLLAGELGDPSVETQINIDGQPGGIIVSPGTDT